MAQPGPARQRTVVALRGVACLFVIVLVGCLLTPPASAVEYFVGVDHPKASDSNHGLSPDYPFKTLGRGTQGLFPGDTLSIMAGVYREVLEIHRSGTAADPIVIRAYPGDEGSVVVRGSDRVTGWTSDGGSVWSVPWVPLPLIDYPTEWPDYGEYLDDARWGFVNGNPLQQVLTQGGVGQRGFLDGWHSRADSNQPSGGSQRPAGGDFGSHARCEERGEELLRLSRAQGRTCHNPTARWCHASRGPSSS